MQTLSVCRCLQGDGEGFSWLDRLAAYLCYHRGLGSDLLTSLQSTRMGLASEAAGGPASASPPASDTAAALLRRLVPETEASHSASVDFGTEDGGAQTMRMLLAVAEASAQRLAQAAASSAVPVNGADLGHVDSLAAALQVCQGLFPFCWHFIASTIPVNLHMDVIILFMVWGFRDEGFTAPVCSAALPFRVCVAGQGGAVGTAGGSARCLNHSSPARGPGLPRHCPQPTALVT